MSDANPNSGDAAADEIPYHLMPLAALLGTYSLLGTLRALYQVYRNFAHDPSKVTAEMRLKGQIPQPLKSRQFVLLVSSIVIAALGYGYVTALVNNSIAGSQIFDPYDILGLAPSALQDEIKSAYRSLSKVHHPDKPTGDAQMFQRINLAYRALSDEVSRENWQKYGHPDGPQTRTLSFAMPDWLLHPTGNVALVLVLMYLGLFVGLIVWVVRYVTHSEAAHAKKERDMSVAGADAAYLATNLTPDSTHMDVLFYIATTPENIEIARGDIEKADKLRAEREEFLAKKSKSESNALGDLNLDDGGWAEDHEDEQDEETKRKIEAAKKEEEEKAKMAAQLAAATGKAGTAEHVKLEGLDDGVLGQKWVERTLEEKGRWPPKLGAIENRTFGDGKGNVQDALENRAVRRNICMTMGRLNAQMLNSHPDLVAAGQKGLIDPTYFKATMEFRQRTGLLLEAALRVAMSARSFRLAKTIVETVSMFKIGTTSHDDPETLAWFTDVMKKQYGGDDGVPRLEFISKDIETPGEDEIATGDTCALQVEIERKHAENFTKQKLALCQKQGIPPQVAMQTYREGWWILIRAKRIGGGGADDAAGSAETAAGDAINDDDADNPLAKMLTAEAKRRFDMERDENRIACAWPFIVSNVAQKKGKVKVQFRAPDVPGRYLFVVAVKSQEFLGADREFSVEKDVLDGEEVERKQREEEEEEGDDESDGEGEEEGDGDDAEEDEPKKTK